MANVPDVMIQAFMQKLIESISQHAKTCELPDDPEGVMGLSRLLTAMACDLAIKRGNHPARVFQELLQVSSCKCHVQVACMHTPGSPCADPTQKPGSVLN